MAVVELELRKPPAVDGLLHWNRVPMVEVTHEFDRVCARGGTIKVDRLPHGRPSVPLARVEGCLVGVHQQ